ncbi:MAG: hypothetical protein LBR22_02460 [Desulfovibrio sp.]|nr:hypothetical protein [Desulfovibrio sp.]
MLPFCIHARGASSDARDLSTPGCFSAYAAVPVIETTMPAAVPVVTGIDRRERHAAVAYDGRKAVFADGCIDRMIATRDGNGNFRNPTMQQTGKHFVLSAPNAEQGNQKREAQGRVALGFAVENLKGLGAGVSDKAKSVGDRLNGPTAMSWVCFSRDGRREVHPFLTAQHEACRTRRRR